MGLFTAMLMMGLVIPIVGVGTVALRAIVIMVIESQVATDDGDEGPICRHVDDIASWPMC